MNLKPSCIVSIAVAFTVAQSSAGTIISSEQSVTGNTTQITLDAAKISPASSVNLSNSNGNLVVNFKSNASNADFYLMWEGSTDGLNFSTTSYDYVKIDIAAVSPGLAAGSCEMFWQDDDSTIGGATNSGTSLGSVTPSSEPFSIIIDLKDGGTNTTEAKGWGPGTLDKFRLDLFQNATNKGKSVTISGITFGSLLSPTPGLGRNNFFKVTHRYAPSANGYFTTPHQIKGRAYWENRKIIDLSDAATISVENQLNYNAGSQTADVFVPSSYEPKKPIGIYIHINAGDSAGLPSNLETMFEKHYLIGASPDSTGNARHDPERFCRVLDLATTLKQKYNVDDSRVYVGGISGGALISSLCGMLYPDMFTGIIPTEHVMMQIYWGKIYTLAEMYEMAANGQRWSHILGMSSYAWNTLAPNSTSWKYNIWIDTSGATMRAHYDPFFDTLNQYIVGMAHTNPAPEVFEKSIIFVDAPARLPKVASYQNWELYAFRSDDPSTVFQSYNAGEPIPENPDLTINRLPNDDFDGDGIDNWYEYLLNTDPTIPNNARTTPLLTISGKVMSLNYRVGASDQQAVLHTSQNLLDWDTTGSGAEWIETVINSGETMGTMRFAPADPTAPKYFFKAFISQQTP